MGVARILFGACVIAVLGYGYLEGLSHGRSNPFDYFGYFTNLTSLLTSAILIASGSSTLRGRSPGTVLVSARAASITGMIVVAVIYNGLVPGTASAPPWVSAILHAVLPFAAVLDWMLVGDRPRLPWRRIWIVLPYPVLWLTVVLVRGATDGWVPYGFLLPERGLPLLAATVAGLLATLLVAAAGVWAGSRLRGVRGALRR
ncbi:Pr6Pr family membrane protein [Leucobacter tenebrionis]|nr:Pr6Pr family membrane protein [Leucobacter tenebrionis]